VQSKKPSDRVHLISFHFIKKIQNKKRLCTGNAFIVPLINENGNLIKENDKQKFQLCIGKWTILCSHTHAQTLHAQTHTQIYKYRNTEMHTQTDMDTHALAQIQAHIHMHRYIQASCTLMVTLTDTHTHRHKFLHIISITIPTFSSFAYSHRNVFGRNQKFNVSLERGQYDSIFKINYTDPWIEGDDKRTSRSINIQASPPLTSFPPFILLPFRLFHFFFFPSHLSYPSLFFSLDSFCFILFHG
jgi:hypothetical protein